MTIDEAIAHVQEVADTRTDLCDECREEHRQLGEWLTELKQLRDSLEKQKLINYELVDENQEFVNENKELKRLLRLAVEDFDFIYREHSCVAIECSTDCPYSDDETYYCKGEWKHAEEASELLGDDKQ